MVKDGEIFGGQKILFTNYIHKSMTNQTEKELNRLIEMRIQQSGMSGDEIQLLIVALVDLFEDDLKKKYFDNVKALFDL